MLNLQSRKYQRQYFFDNNLHQYFDENDLENHLQIIFIKILILYLSQKLLPEILGNNNS